MKISPNVHIYITYKSNLWLILEKCIQINLFIQNSIYSYRVESFCGPFCFWTTWTCFNKEDCDFEGRCAENMYFEGKVVTLTCLKEANGAQTSVQPPWILRNYKADSLINGSFQKLQAQTPSFCESEQYQRSN